MKTLGVREKSSKDLRHEEIERNGFTILRQCLSTEQVAILKAIANSHISTLSAEEKLESAEIGDQGTYRALFCRYREYADILVDPSVKPLVDYFLDGEYQLYSQVLAVSSPGEPLNAAGWHREIFYQHLVSSRPLAMQSLFVLDTFNAETGGTLFIPGSHLFEEFPSDSYVEKHCLQPELQAGDCVVMNSMVYHRAGENSSLPNRALVTNTFVRPFISTQFDYTRMIEAPNTAFDLQLFGFRWNSNMTLDEWREAKLK